MGRINLLLALARLGGSHGGFLPEEVRLELDLPLLGLSDYESGRYRFEADKPGPLDAHVHLGDGGELLSAVLQSLENMEASYSLQPAPSLAYFPEGVIDG